METTTIEVKFSAGDIQEDAKRTALQAYEENNYTLGLFFANKLPEEPKVQQPADVSSITFPPEKVDLEELKHVTATFENCLTALRAGQVEHGLKLAESEGLLDRKSPVLSFLPMQADETVTRLRQSGSMLPWTSGDSITIIPL